ncbi:GNAT family N-acetyltransferase [Oceanobacillus sojae]|uniref:GNAT family N-acetyltransferase n=1 Tax=Oceanobacillus sojae TaxID=582851 RepID=UPI0009883BEE|nr:GNAT family N-acetyltransferase [Oceanobacillus sojae]
MSYKKIKEILPSELIELIQEYIDGEYIYIPIKQDNKKFIEAIPNITNEFLKLGMILKETNEFIGFCNTGIKEGLSEPNREIAYAVSKRYRNRGYTTQAVRCLVTYLFENTNIEHINAVVLPKNTASNKIIKKCGFVFCEEVVLEGQLHYHYILKRNGID